MRFLIIGASGFVGRHTLARARAQGHTAIGSQSRPGQGGDLFRFDLLHDRIGERVGASFLDSDTPTVGVISVAFPTLEAYVTQRELTRKIHVENTIRLISDLRCLGIRPVFLSTNYVFDGQIGYYNENDYCNPVTEYGRSKRSVEEFIKAECPEGLILRLQAVIGNNPEEKHLFTRWRQLIDDRRPLECIEGEIIAPTLVDDVARGIVMACELGLRGLYHLAGLELFTRDELASQFIRAIDADADVILKPASEFGFLEQRPLKCYLDSSRFREATGMNFTSMNDTFQKFRDSLMVDMKLNYSTLNSGTGRSLPMAG